MNPSTSNFLIELAAVHVALMFGYWAILRKERQHAFVRFYLLSSVALAVIIPLLKLPRLFGAEEPAAVLPVPRAVVDTVAAVPLQDASFWSTGLLIGAYLLVSTVLLLKFCNSLRRLILLRTKSESEPHRGLRIFRVPDIQGSFSFFNWIFIGRNIVEDDPTYEVMLAHEKAHAELGHTFDILFVQLFRICFWWLPTAWLLNTEIKKIHEYQADARVLRSYSVEEYSSLLISSTLTLHGLSLVSSFHDSLILKRLIAMKDQTKKMRVWKMAALTVLCASLVIGFACTEEKNQNTGSPDAAGAEIFKIVEKAPDFEGGIDAFKKYIMKEVKYPREARQKNIEGRVNVQFAIDKDGSLTDVVAVNGKGGDLEREAERVIRSVPAFKPAMQQGKPVKVRLLVPIVFTLDTKDKENPKGIIIIDEVQSLNAKFKVTSSYGDGEWTGTVRDENGDALPGVNLIVEGTSTGTISDANGEFRLKAERSQNVVMSFIGYDFVKLEGSR